jgi:hypothetical protein
MTPWHRSPGAGPARSVLALYHSDEHAREALDELKKQRFRRSAVVHRTRDGQLKVTHALPRTYRAAWSGVLALTGVLIVEALDLPLWVTFTTVFSATCCCNCCWRYLSCSKRQRTASTSSSTTLLLNSTQNSGCCQ